MANTYTSLHYHFVFNTKHRERWITEDIERRVWSFLGLIARDNEMTALSVGGIEDHVHLLIGARPTMAPAKAVQLIKGGSSKWIHVTFPQLSLFTWQDGYGAFTVSKSNIPAVMEYIQNQREHHKTKTFKEEFLERTSMQRSQTPFEHQRGLCRRKRMRDECANRLASHLRRLIPSGRSCHASKVPFPTVLPW